MNTSEILKGVRVLAIETQVAAPHCTMMLADQGAEVIKIERPGVGDAAREMAPILKGEDGDTVSGYFARFNRNKKSVALNFTTPEGLAVLKEMIARSDIIVENNRPGTMDKIGLTWEVVHELNPKAVYIAISGFGRLPQYQSPFADRPAYDIIAQAMGGLMHLAGQKEGPPTWLGISIDNEQYFSTTIGIHNLTAHFIQLNARILGKTAKTVQLALNLENNLFDAERVLHSDKIDRVAGRPTLPAAPRAYRFTRSSTSWEFTNRPPFFACTRE